jgi:hypothetical protein
MGASGKSQVELTLRSHLEYNARASMEAEPGQELALGIVDMDMPVPFRSCACVRGYGQVRPFEVSDMDHHQTCSRLGWTVMCFVVTAAMISTIRTRPGCLHSVIVQIVQVDRWDPCCVKVVIN